MPGVGRLARVRQLCPLTLGQCNKPRSTIEQTAAYMCRPLCLLSTQPLAVTTAVVDYVADAVAAFDLPDAVQPTAQMQPVIR